MCFLLTPGVSVLHWPWPTGRARKNRLVPSFPLPDKRSQQRRSRTRRGPARRYPAQPLAVSASLGAAVFMGVPSFYAWVKKRYPLMVQHVHHTCSDSPDGQAGTDSVYTYFIHIQGETRAA